MEPIEPDWVAISSATHPIPGKPPSYILYFIGSSGDILEVLQWDTIQIALDQARQLANVDDSGWATCNLDVPSSGPFDPDQFVQYLAG